MAGQQMDRFIICLAEAVNETEEDGAEIDENFGNLLSETLVSSPQFSWLSGNIRADIDATAKN
ncbi:MAG: hypothetical protein ABSD38_10585 [Syntrophorhabdales bacterium]